MRVTFALCVAVGITGCASPALVPSVAGDSKAELVPVARVEQLDMLVREPMVIEHPSGALFVAGYNRVRPAIWKSLDHGATWARLNVGNAENGAIGNSDVDLAVSRDGILYFITMGYDRRGHHGTHVAVGVSRDIGTTWHWTMLSQTIGDDRPWIAVTPNGVAHAIWNDGRGVNHATSTDSGMTWVRQPRIYPRGGSSHLAIGPHGEIAARISPGSASGNKCEEGVDFIAVSTDDGKSWAIRAAPGGPRDSGCSEDTTQIQRWVDPVAWDSAGSLYSLWTTKNGVFLGRSMDSGVSWTTLKITNEHALSYFPYLVASGPGVLAASWVISGAGGLRWRVARIDMAAGRRPTVSLSAAMALESWLGNPQHSDAGGEYLAVALLRDGSVGAVTPIQHERAGRLGFTWWRFETR